MDLHNDRDAATETNVSSYVASNTSASVRSIELHEPPALALDENGVIQRCSESCEELFGYRSLELVKQHVSRLFPQLSEVKLVLDGQFNPMLDFLCHCGHLFQAQNRQGNTFKSELSFVRIEHGGRRSLRLIVRPLKNEQLPRVLSRG